MARRARFRVAGGWYHLSARGHNREAVFGADEDCAHFLELIARMRELYRVHVHAYALMPNHYHLLVTTPEGNVSRAVQWLNGSYGTWYNRRHDRCGHLFGERFKAVLLENGARGLEVSLYLHMNPVATRSYGLGKREKSAQGQGIRAPSPEEVQQRLKGVRTYPWSSYRAYAGYVAMPPWLDGRTLLTRMGKGGIEAQARAYRQMFEDRIRQGVEEDLWSRVRWGVVLGSERFARKVRGHIRISAETLGRRELRARRDFSEIIGMVERLKGERWRDFRDRYGDWGRDLALWAGRRFCGMMIAELGAAVGGIAGCSVTLAITRLQQRARHQRDVACAMRTIEQKCKM